MPQCVVTLDVDACNNGGGARRVASDPCVRHGPPHLPEQRRRRVSTPTCAVPTTLSTSGDTVRAEFVYGDGGAVVALCGDWNRWRPQPMEREADGMWSVIVTVPTGRREFCYFVDGRYAVSRRHPTNAEKSANWRTVNGPPESEIDVKKIDRRPALLRVADRAALSLRSALVSNVLPSDLPQRRGMGAGVRCVAMMAAGLLLVTAIVVVVLLLNR